MEGKAIAQSVVDIEPCLILLVTDVHLFK